MLRYGLSHLQKLPATAARKGTTSQRAIQTSGGAMNLDESSPSIRRLRTTRTRPEMPTTLSTQTAAGSHRS